MTRPCEYPGTNHSADRVEVWHGEATAMILCGFHASQLGPRTYEVVRQARQDALSQDTDTPVTVVTPAGTCVAIGCGHSP